MVHFSGIKLLISKQCVRLSWFCNYSEKWHFPIIKFPWPHALEKNDEKTYAACVLSTIITFLRFCITHAFRSCQKHRILWHSRGFVFIFFPNFIKIFFCLDVILYCQMKRFPDKRSNSEPCYCYYNNYFKVAVCIDIIRQKLLPNISTIQEPDGTPDGVYRASTRSNPKTK